MKKKKNLQGLIFYLVILIVLVFAGMFLFSRGETVKVTYSQLLNMFDNEQIDYFSLKENVLNIRFKKGYDVSKILSDNAQNTKTLKKLTGNELIKKSNVTLIKDENFPNNQTIQIKVAYPDLFMEDIGATLETQRKNGIISYEIKEPSSTGWWLSWLPFIIIGGILIFFWIYSMNQMSGGGKASSFGKAKTKMASTQGKKVTFKDVAGAKEEKEELEEIVEFLKNPRKFMSLGARIPKGVLLVGPPGTGKTLLAKAVAGEAGVPFFSISGSDFVELYVGIGAARVRDLFDTAKKNAPCIIFIDEIDAVGRRRGAGLGGGHDEREQTLNQMLVEMDGFGANEGVIVIAATNRADVLDPALLRPGRFDRQVGVGLPDMRGRVEILHVHARGKVFADDVNFEEIAKSTPGFSGADLENLLNEAALLAARENKKAITNMDIKNAVNKVIMGAEKKSHIMTEQERKLTAYHEAGHAVVTYYLETQDPVHQISIIPTAKGAGGYTWSLPNEDISYYSKRRMKEDIIVFLGGRAAESIVLKDISTGASNDIQRATAFASDMITKYGMSDNLGPRIFGSDNDEVFIGRDFAHEKNYSEKYAAMIDDEITQMIENSYEKAISILKEHIDKLENVAKRLLSNEKIEGDEFDAIMKGEDPDEAVARRPVPKPVTKIKTVVDTKDGFSEEEINIEQNEHSAPLLNGVEPYPPLHNNDEIIAKMKKDSANNEEHQVSDEEAADKSVNEELIDQKITDEDSDYENKN